MQPLDDDALANVVGQEGVALDIELRINADEDGNPLSSLGNCSGLGNPCVLALQFNNRNSGGGEWLVLKDYYGVMKINSLFLDASQTPAGNGNYANPSRFFNQAGDACLASGVFPNCNINDVPALSMSFEGDAATFEDDILWHLNVGRMAVQYGPEGYLPSNDNGKSFLGLRISDTTQNMARIDIDGSITLTGF